MYLIWYTQGPKAAAFIAEHYPVVVLGPLAATAAFVVVSVFSQTEGPIRFKGLGFEFEGGAGPVILWVVCFLSVVGAIRMFW